MSRGRGKREEEQEGEALLHWELTQEKEGEIEVARGRSSASLGNVRRSVREGARTCASPAAMGRCSLPSLLCLERGLECIDERQAGNGGLESCLEWMLLRPRRIIWRERSTKREEM